jgi:hypothetical protein
MAENTWATLPQQVRNRAKFIDSFSKETVQNEVEQLLLFSVVSNGINSWYAAFYRGLLSSDPAQDHIAKVATTLVAQSIPY